MAYLKEMPVYRKSIKSQSEHQTRGSDSNWMP